MLLRSISFLILISSFSSTYLNSQEAQEKVNALLFTPPKGWGYSDPQSLPKSVKLMVIGESKGSFPPSINLSIEPFEGTLADYLKIVKAINASQNNEWKNLGPIHTQAGRANLSQVDSSSKWGPIRLMHVILVRDHTAYIMTSAASRDEFSRFYKQFFQSMRSLRFDSVAPTDITDYTQLQQQSSGISG